MEIRRDLARNTLAIACILALIGLSLWVLRPFLAATVWATMIVVATWPLFSALEARLGQRRAPAIVVMTLGMLVLLVLPLWLTVDTVAEHAEILTAFGQNLATRGLPPMPDWMANLPLVGRKLALAWLQFSAGGASGLVTKITPYGLDVGKWALAQVGGLGGMLLQFLMIVTISGIFYASGEAWARMLRRLGQRLAGDRGENAIVLAARAIRGVALGVGLTAVVQSVLGGIGLVLVGVPFAALLAVIMLILCIAQIGPAPILLPAVGWMFWQGDPGWAIFLLVWSLLVIALDSFLRPLLIKRGADLPVLLIFAGVIGGLLGFGLIGIFLGPVALAVTYTLMLAWLDDVTGDTMAP